MGVASPPQDAGLEQLVQAARSCRACDLWEGATQTVFGAGPVTARAVLVGEQPGDVEDRRGEPFVGPAGRLLDKALVEAGIAREDAYVTNAVKHFRFRAGQGKRRIHQTPGPEHLAACRPWLDAELALLSPEVVVCLGAVAAKSLLGPSFRVTKSRGQLMPFEKTRDEDAGVHSAWIMGTNHPSAILRAPEESRGEAYGALVADLRVAAGVLS